LKKRRRPKRLASRPLGRQLHEVAVGIVRYRQLRASDASTCWIVGDFGDSRALRIFGGERHLARILERDSLFGVALGR
jgi:hypothetical protein